jgi:prolyl oligopeptidase
MTMPPIACRSAIRAVATAIAATLLAWPAIATAQQEESLHYPATRTVGTVADFHGTRIADPYRWLESIDSADVAAWVKAQNAVTLPYLAALPGRDAL